MIQSSQRNVGNPISTRNFLTKAAETINRQSTAILGNASWGIPFVPTFVNKNFNDDNQNDILQSFETNFGSFSKNHVEFQGNILPYIAGYSVLERGGQLNYMRLAGLDLPDFPHLKPGFLLDASYSLYLMTFQFKTKEINKNFFNFENATDIPKQYYQAIILAKNCQLSISALDNNQLSLNIFGADNETQAISADVSQKELQDKIFFAQSSNKPPRNITFDFNINSDFYWKDVLNTNIHRLNDFRYAIIHYDDIFNKINYEHTQIDNATVSLNLLSNNFKNFQEACQSATTPWFVSQGFYNNQQIDDRLSDGVNLKDRVVKLFKIHAISPGKTGNNYVIKIIPNSLTESNGWAQFHLHLLDKNTERVIRQFDNLDLNPKSSNFIGRVIGTQQIYFDTQLNRVVSSFNDYISQNPWIRVELSDDVLNMTIPEESIPTGFLGHNQIKNNLIPNLNILNKNYVTSPQFDNITSENFEFVNLLTTHAWGDNLKNIEIKKVIVNKINYKATSADILKGRKSNAELAVLEYTHKLLHLNRGINQHEYLNKFFYNNYNVDNYDDMFHLEKILLLNKHDDIKTIQYWQLARYFHSGQNLLTVKDLDEKFWSEQFENNGGLEKIFYYFTINKKGFITDNVDTISEVKRFSNINILSFNVEMTGGWDGLNLLDLDEYCINDKGLVKSQYLQELYKLGLSVIFEEVNCISDFIYLPEIFQSNVIEKAVNLAADNSKTILLLDQPFYDLNNNITYSRDYLKLDAGQNDIEFKWSDQKYVYINQNLGYDFNQTMTNWNQNYNQLSNITSFGNYMIMRLLSGIDKKINVSGKEQNLIIPAGLFALNALVIFDSVSANRKMNPIYNINISDLGDLTVIDVLDNSFNGSSLIKEKNTQLINNLNINCLYSDIKNQQTVYSFYSDKTHQFSNGNNSILSKLNVRNTLNNIKKTIKWASYSQLFSKIDSPENVTNRLNLIYTTILNNYLKNRLITNFKVKLDTTTTSKEDLLIGLVRGSIYIQFNNQEIAQVNV